MNSIFYDIIFFLVSMYILLKTIGYGFYEINQNENKLGGITVITFSIIVVIFANIVMIIN